MSGKAIKHQDLEKTARLIVSRKCWPVVETAQFLGYSRNYMDVLITRWDWAVTCPGGDKHIYAIDILDKFQEQNDVRFPELAMQWYRENKLDPPSGTSSN